MGRQPTKEGKQEQDKLHQQYTHLEKEWDSIKQTRPRTRRRSTSSNPRTILRAIQLLESSPRTLMSVLQHGKSPPEGSGGEWKVRTNDMAVAEILTDRRAAIRSGKLKGRQLFTSPGEKSRSGDMGREEIPCSGALNGWSSQEREVQSVYSYDSDDENGNSGSVQESASSSSSSQVCDQCIRRLVMAEEEKKAVVAIEEEEEKCLDVGESGEQRRTWKAAFGWLASGLILTVVAIKSFAPGYGDRRERMTLVPT
ncbi:hypothetical protein Tsubulata_029910 [Turnera subulata]|uniref:Uncharacterized protein n=1 Tax=Turnera subulata TaxID=218843 RepID=A0A9Q0JEE2_9ROSI|nr:hypothetical protein Tsubulata_029910 [Turnera subulata]